jgi:hypothetical protein
MVAVLIAGVWVVMVHEDYEEDRQKFWAYWAEYSGGAVGTIGKKWIVDPATGTFQLIQDNLPGHKFFQLLYETLAQWATQIPGKVMGWFSSALGVALSQFKDILTTAVSGAVQSSVSKLKFW